MADMEYNTNHKDATQLQIFNLDLGIEATLITFGVTRPIYCTAQGQYNICSYMIYERI